jgi:tripartite-type tricarboxylate transporter receptor subunit TctC
MRGTLGQRIIVENVAGAAGSIGAGRVARTVPDGHTLGLGQWGTHVLNGALYSLPYDVINDFEPVSLIAENPLLVVARKSLPAKDLTELIAWLNANREKASQGTSGVGGASHVAGVLFQQLSETQFQFVPYRGAGPAMQAVAAGQVDLMFDSPTTSLSLARAGILKAYAVTAKRRLAAAPEIPTVEKAGLPGLHVSVWYALFAPRHTPRPIIDKLNTAVGGALGNPQVRQRLMEMGLELPARGQQTPEALAAYQKAEIEKWWPIVKAAGIKAE